MPHRLSVPFAVLLLALVGTAPVASAWADDLATPFPSAAAQAEVPAPSGSAVAAPPRTGRYTMVPADGGFVRLDTETGVVSQCRRETPGADSGWRCAAIPESRLNEPDRTDELAERVDTLSREVAELRARLDASEKAEAMAPQAVDDAEFNRALDFSEQLMQRFFGMVREIKRSEPRDPR